MEFMKYAPAVFAVGNEYQIMIPVSGATLAWVKVGEQYFFDDSNGILRSDTDIHKVYVPAKVLDGAKKYTVCLRPVIERKPYRSVMGEVCEKEYGFRPLSNKNFRAYQIADTHGLSEPAVNAACFFEKEYGEIDLLIFNGDVLDHSGSVSNFEIIYKLSDEITGGCIPVVVSRGNHDLRGVCAEKLADYTPGDNGKSYYSFRVGSLWGLVLDCGEDKNDDHPEYAGTVCCHSFRAKETDFLEKLIENADKEYNAKGVEHRIVVSHVPFTRKEKDPFNIEEDTYGHWVELLNYKIKPGLMISGHIHRMNIDMPKSDMDAYKMSFPVVVGSKLIYNEEYFAGAGFVFEENKVTVVFNDNRNVLETASIEL